MLVSTNILNYKSFGYQVRKDLHPLNNERRLVVVVLAFSYIVFCCSEFAAVVEAETLSGVVKPGCLT